MNYETRVIKAEGLEITKLVENALELVTTGSEANILVPERIEYCHNSLSAVWFVLDVLRAEEANGCVVVIPVIKIWLKLERLLWALLWELYAIKGPTIPAKPISFNNKKRF